jgi:SWIM zinc finger
MGFPITRAAARRGAVAARRAHNPKVGGSNPPAATKLVITLLGARRRAASCPQYVTHRNVQHGEYVSLVTGVVSLPPLPRNVVQIKKLQQASQCLMVVPHDPERGRYLVESASHSGRHYEVAVQRDALSGHCTCPWAQYGGINCKHVLAALRAQYEPWGALSFWPTRADARRQHRRILPGERLYATLRPRRRRRVSRI